MLDALVMATPDVLWNQFLQGSDEAYVTIYRENIRPMFRYGMNFIDDRECIKDCIHDVFANMYKNRRVLSETDNVRLYLFVALKNRLVDVFRRDKQVEFLELDSINATPQTVVAGKEYDDEVMRREIMRLLERLSPRQREAIYYHYIEEFSHTEIAKLMGIEYQSVQNLIQRALIKLKEINKEQLPPIFLKEQ